VSKLYFYYSAMNAGKSTALLQSRYNYLERGMKTLQFIPAELARKPLHITSRIGLEAPALEFDINFDFLKHTPNQTVDAVFVDEAQLLTKRQVTELSNLVDIYNVPVLCYGLRTDYRRELFTGSKQLLAVADVIAEIKTICFCGRAATTTLRIDADGYADTGSIDDNGDQIELGGNESYVSVCRKHHKLGLYKCSKR